MQPCRLLHQALSLELLPACHASWARQDPAQLATRNMSNNSDAALAVQSHHKGTTTSVVPLATLFLRQARMPSATLATRAQRWPTLG